jgi:hypothetical protein
VLTVLTYFWNPDPGSKFAAAYTADDVRRLQQQVARHLPVGHRFAVVTDRPEMFYGDRDIHPIPIDWATHVPGTCFVRLMTFHPKGQEIFGKRVLQLDLDTLVVGDLAPLVERDEPLVLWRNPALHPSRPGRSLYNTSVLLHRCGTMPELWKCFLNLNKKVPAKDDQWYLSDALGPDVPHFDGQRDGVYRIARDDTPGSGVNGALPANARIVTFPGSNGKWTLPHVAAANPWIEKHLAVA